MNRDVCGRDAGHSVNHAAEVDGKGCSYTTSARRRSTGTCVWNAELLARLDLAEENLSDSVQTRRRVRWVLHIRGGIVPWRTTRLTTISGVMKYR